MINERTVKRFWKYVQKTDDCWLWIGSKFHTGYGQFWCNGTNARAHRISYILANGNIPTGSIILHSCDNPACVNPAHLSAGTAHENMKDASVKGRLPDRRGENCPTAKLSKELVKEIRDRYRSSDLSVAQLAEDYNVTPSNLMYILNNKTWKDDTYSKKVEPKQRRGSVAPRAGLTEDQVKAIRVEFASGGITGKQLAQKYSTGISAIKHILARRSWCHI